MNYHKQAIEILCNLHDGDYVDLIRSIAINTPSALVKAYNNDINNDIESKLMAVKNAYKTLKGKGDKVAAIKEYRNQFGDSLLTAKNNVEKMIESGEISVLS